MPASDGAGTGPKRTQFAASDGKYRLARSWSHPNGPVVFNPAAGSKVTVAKLPAPRGHHRPARYLVFNVNDTLLVYDYDEPSVAAEGAAKRSSFYGGYGGYGGYGPSPKPPSTPDDPNATKPADPIRTLQFPGTLVTCHAFREQNGGHQNQNDLLIGLANGEVVLTSLRALVGERHQRSTSLDNDDDARSPSAASSGASSAKLPPGSLRFNTDGGGGFGGSERARLEHPANASRCNHVAWCGNGGVDRLGGFVTCHGDGNVYAYSVSRDASVDPWFPAIAGDPNAPSVTPGRSGKDGQTLANPFARWHLGAGPMSCASFSPDGQYLAVAGGADGICRILDVTHWERPRLCGGFKSYYGGLRTVRWAGDGHYVLAAGESDLVEVWAVPEGRYCAAWADGHASWVACACEDAHVLDDADHDHDSDHDDDRDAVGLNRVKSPGPVRMQDASGTPGGGVANYDDLLVTDDRAETLRFGSVGQDCQLCLWDLPLEATGGDAAGGDPAVGGVNIPGAPSTGPDDGFESDGAFEPPPPPPPPVPIPVLPAGTAPPNASSSSSLLKSVSSMGNVPSGMMRSASKSMLSSMGSMGVSGGKSGLGKSSKAGGAADVGGNGNGNGKDGVGKDGVDSGNASAASSPTTSPAVSRRASLDAEAADEADAGVAAGGAAGGAEADKSAGPSIHSYVGDLICAPATRREVPETLAPTAAYKIHAEPCTDVAFTEEGVVTACAAGVVKLWIRPLHGEK